MRLLPLASITLACALGAAAARADNVTFTGFAHGSETVAFSLIAPNVTAAGTVNAGGFATILNGSPSFVTYCVDLYQHINFGTLYPEYTAPGTTHVFANNRAYADLGRLYANAGVVDTSVEEAAFQIAVGISGTSSSVPTMSRSPSGRSPMKRRRVPMRSAAVRRASAAAAPPAARSASPRRGSPAWATARGAASA